MAGFSKNLFGSYRWIRTVKKELFLVLVFVCCLLLKFSNPLWTNIFVKYNVRVTKYI